MIDAIVIGSGPNGLAAAIRLAEAGREVTVLEAADQYGGAVRSEALILPGFAHDTFSSVYPAGAASPVFARMPLERHGLAWCHPEACYANPLPNGRAAVLHRSLTETAASLDALHPGDGASWISFAEPYVEAFAAVRDTMLAGFPPIRGPLELLANRGPLGLLRFVRLLPDTSTRLADRLFTASGSRAWLHGSALHGDAPPDAAGSAIAGFYLNVFGHAVGWPSPVGGAGRLADALVGYLRSLGGTVRTSAPVTGISSMGGRVTGVLLADGTSLTAPIMIADVMPHALIALTGDALRASYRSALTRYRYGASTLKVDWALDGPIPWTAEAVRQSGTVHVAGDEADLLAAVSTSRSGLPERPFLLLVDRRSHARAGWQAHRVGIHARTATGCRLDRPDRTSRRARRSAGRTVRARLPGSDPRAARPIAA